MKVKLALALLSAAGSGAFAAPAARLYAGGSWAALDRGTVCEAATRSERIAAKGKVQAIAGFAFSADRRRWGEFYTRLSRPTRGDSTVMLTIGDQPFLLASRGQWAWSRGPAQQDAIVTAARGNAWMQVEARDPAGVRFRDPYRLDGAPTAIDAAAARCAGKMR
ncbi:MAG: hypothetical protein ACJ8EY_05260 [Sphingomicrobium sp.]